MPTPFKPETLYDWLDNFSGGVNEGDSPLDLLREVMSGAINTTVSGKNVTHRPVYHRRPVSYPNSDIQTAVETGYFQGCCDYLSDTGFSSKIAFISNRVFQFSILGNAVTCAEILVNNGSIVPNSQIQPQAWLWQAEKWAIIQDGLNNPIFVDGTGATAARSQYTAPVPFATTLAADLTPIPAANSQITVNFTSVANLALGDIVTFPNFGTMQVLAIAGVAVTLVNLDCTPVGGLIANTSPVTWVHQGVQLPPGRMGVYGLGRNWFSLVDGKQFVASDIVGGASGTQALNFRDAVLYIRENLFLVGGGNFTVPGSVGDIRAMRFTATLDVSLGQGPLQIFTHNTVFSCQAPVDRLTWQSVTNPILTESLISNGALGQNSTISANGDLIFRSIDGARSLILARRDFDTWGNVPISFEVGPILDRDDPGLLPYGSAIVFDNRLLLTTGTKSDAQGVYFQGIVPLNFDPISSLRGKLPSVWDSGVWTGLNLLQLTVGEVEEVQRAFAFVLNLKTGSKRIEFWEILPQSGPNSALYDNDGTKDIPVTWQFDSASLRFEVPKSDRKYLQLANGEIWVDSLVGTVNFQIQYKPDQFPCWTDWRAWSACQAADASTSQPGFQPRMGLGEPNPEPCDTSTNRPMREGFTFQTRNIIQGHCTFLGAFYEVNRKPMPKFAPIICTPLCPQT